MLVVDRHRPRQFGPLLLAFRHRPGFANIGDDEGVGDDAFGMAHHAVAVGQVLDHVVANPERGPVPADPRLALHQRALELVAADHLMQHEEVPRVDDVLVVLQPVAVLDIADRVVAPEAHPAQLDIAAAVRVDDVIGRKQGLAAGRAHIDEDEPAIFERRIGRLPHIEAPPGLLALAWHVDALALRVVKPAVVAAAQAALLDPAPFERGAAMRAMWVERADPALLVAKDDDLLAQQLFLARQIAKLVRRAHGLPIAAHQFAHRAARLDAGQLVIGSRNLRSIG